MEQYEIDLFAFAETNIAWTPKNKYRLRNLGKQYFGQIKIEASSNEEPAVNMFQPGGTMIGAIGNIQRRVITATKDPHGLRRWIMVCLTGEATKVFTVSAYQVSQENNSGTHTAYMQQHRLLSNKGIKIQFQGKNGAKIC
eukprot:11385036-Ditylum_brightwellii.AAC.1